MRAIPPEMVLYLKEAMKLHKEKNVYDMYKAFNKLIDSSMSFQFVGLAHDVERFERTNPDLIYMKYLERFYNYMAENPNNMKMLMWLLTKVPSEELVLTEALEWAEDISKNNSLEYICAIRKFSPDDNYMNVMHPNGFTPGAISSSLDSEIGDYELPEDYVPFKHPHPTGTNCWIYRLYMKEKQNRG